MKLTMTGGTELAAALATLPTKVSTRVLLAALTEAAVPLRDDMASKAARSDEPPHIADNIGISPARTEDQAAVAVGPTKDFPYGVPLEVGTVDTPAQPFARPAYDGSIDRSLTIVGQVLWRELAGQGISRPTAVADGGVQTPGGGGVL